MRRSWNLWLMIPFVFLTQQTIASSTLKPNVDEGTDMNLKSDPCSVAKSRVEEASTKVLSTCEMQDSVPVVNRRELLFTLSKGELEGLSTLIHEGHDKLVCDHQSVLLNMTVSLTGVSIRYIWKATVAFTLSTGSFSMSADKVLLGVTMSFPLKGNTKAIVQNLMVVKVDNFQYTEEGGGFFNGIAIKSNSIIFPKFFQEEVETAVSAALSGCFQKHISEHNLHEDVSNSTDFASTEHDLMITHFGTKRTSDGTYLTAGTKSGAEYGEKSGEEYGEKSREKSRAHSKHSKHISTPFAQY